MPMRQLRRIARIDDVHKLHTLHHASTAHIQTSNNPSSSASTAPESSSTPATQSQPTSPDETALPSHSRAPQHAVNAPPYNVVSSSIRRNRRSPRVRVIHKAPSLNPLQQPRIRPNRLQRIPPHMRRLQLRALKLRRKPLTLPGKLTQALAVSGASVDPSYKPLQPNANPQETEPLSRARLAQPPSSPNPAATA